MFYDVNFAVFMIHQQMLAESSQSNPACIPYKRNEAAYNLGYTRSWLQVYAERHIEFGFTTPSTKNFGANEANLCTLAGIFYNCFIESGIYPSKLKIAGMPIYIANDCFDLNNDRPVSLVNIQLFF